MIIYNLCSQNDIENIGLNESENYYFVYCKEKRGGKFFEVLKYIEEGGGGGQLICVMVFVVCVNLYNL